MSAFDEILAYSSKEKFNDFRQSLVAHKRGTLSSGSLSSSMSVQYENNASQADIPQDDSQTQNTAPQKILLKSGKTPQPGIVFDENGTDRAISIVSNGGKLKLLDEFGDLLKFGNQGDKDNWLGAERKVKKRCLSRNVEELIKKTDINYRTHGDRLHYFVVGLVEIKADAEWSRYPLFLFSCSDINKNSLETEIETTGFLNFWLDKNYLENNLTSSVGGYEINMNEKFASVLNNIAGKINNLQLSSFDEIKVDPKYSAIAIVTGFEAEYIDPFWERLK